MNLPNLVNLPLLIVGYLVFVTIDLAVTSVQFIVTVLPTIHLLP